MLNPCYGKDDTGNTIFSSFCPTKTGYISYPGGRYVVCEKIGILSRPFLSDKRLNWRN